MSRVSLPWAPGPAQRPGDLSDLLLQDVATGPRTRMSRIEDAVRAVQAFVQRARLGLEPGFTVTPAFARLWETRFASYDVWQAAARRDIYLENWIEWDDLRAARKVEAFRFLEQQLRRSTLTVAVPGGGTWWPDSRPPGYSAARGAAGPRAGHQRSAARRDRARRARAPGRPAARREPGVARAGSRPGDWAVAVAAAVAATMSHRSPIAVLKRRRPRLPGQPCRSGCRPRPTSAPSSCAWPPPASARVGAFHPVRHPGGLLRRVRRRAAAGSRRILLLARRLAILPRHGRSARCRRRRSGPVAAVRCGLCLGRPQPVAGPAGVATQADGPPVLVQGAAR